MSGSDIINVLRRLRFAVSNGKAVPGLALVPDIHKSSVESAGAPFPIHVFI